MNNLSAVSLILAFTSLASADTITVTYSGSITVGDVPGIANGDPFSGGFTYDTSDPFVLSTSLASVYYLEQAGDGLFLNVDGYNFTAGPGYGLTTTVSNGPTNVASVLNADYFQVSQGYSNQTSPNFSTNYTGLLFTETAVGLVGNLNLLQSNALPDPFNAADVVPYGVQYPGGPHIESGVSIEMIDSNSDTFFFGGDIQQIEAVSTPEPRLWSVLVLIGAIFALIHKSRPRHAVGAVLSTARRSCTCGEQQIACGTSKLVPCCTK